MKMEKFLHEGTDTGYIGREMGYIPTGIGLDKSGYQVYGFLISQQKHMLWVFIRSTYNMFLLRNKKTIDTFWLKKKIALSRAMHTGTEQIS